LLDSLADYLKSKNYDRVAAIYVDNEAGEAAQDAFNAVAKEAGITVTGSESVDPASLDATAALSKLRSGNPQALIVGGIIGPVAGTILKSRTKLGWDVPTVADATTAANDFGTLVSPKDLNNVVVQVQPYAVKGSAQQDTEAFKTFFAALKKRNPKLDLSIDTYAVAYGTVTLTKAAAEKAKSTDPAKLAEAMQSLTVAQAPLWFQTPNLGYTADNHYPDYSKLAFVPAGPRVDGSVEPGGSGS
jgi:branched-chain amino acid transport system substrate-binding protein